MRAYLDGLIGSETPGLQYLALKATETLFEHYAGWADIRNRRPMEAATTLSGYSLSKTITAAATLHAISEHLIRLDDRIEGYLPLVPYGPGITIRQLLTHTSGIPNPLPLRWVHTVAEHRGFKEAGALQTILQRHPRTRAQPGENYFYSNIGYWLLGAILEKAAGRPFIDYVREAVFDPLEIPPPDLSYAIPNAAGHAHGYLEKYSWINLAKSFLIDRRLVGDYEGRWLRIEPHYVNGPAFGGLIGNVRGLARFLQDQLRDDSVLFGKETRRLFYERQTTNNHTPLPMTLGWHIGGGTRPFFFKEGGGGGFHSMMRLYPDAGVATILWSNATGFNIRACMGAVDQTFL